MNEAQMFVRLRRRDVAAAAARKGRRRRDLDRRHKTRSRRPQHRPDSHTYAVAPISLQAAAIHQN